MKDILRQNRDKKMLDKRVVIAMSHPRSGGSLLAQCFEDVEGGAEVFNEPEIFMHFAVQIGDLPLLKQILICFCQMFWTKKRHEAPSTIVIKMPPQYPWLLRSLLAIEEDLKPFFDLSCVFLYRKPIDLAKSTIK